MRTRILLLAATCLVLLPSTAPAAREVLREQSQVTVDAGALKAVAVQNPRGWVEIRPSTDGRIHVSALKLCRAGDPARAQRFARLTRVETDTRDGRFSVRVFYPQNQMIRVDFWRFFKGDFDLPGVEVRLSLEVPPALAVELSAASGDLRTFELSGPQSLQTVSGEVEVRDASGPVNVSSTSGNVSGSLLARTRVRSVSGDVSLDGVRGALSVSTTSGDVEARAVTDSLDFSTVSGDIRVDAAPRGIRAGSTSGSISVDGMAAGWVRLRSTSGEVHTGLERGLRGADIRTVSGDIELRLAEDLGCALTLTSQSGSLDNSAPLRVRTVSHHEISGVVGNGGPAVTLHSSSGDIAVTGGGR